MTPTQRENEALVRGFLTEVVAGGDTAATEVFLTDAPVEHNPVFGEGRGDEPATALGWRVLAGADVAVDVESVVATAETVAVRGVVRGTHRQSLVDLAPTGAPFEIACAWFCRVEGDRIAEIWSLPDGLGLLADIGALPEPTTYRPPTDRGIQQR